ncbi:thiazole synthase [Carboxydothermus hydrogenoformans]|uniref:thiazole synthase n=1 Tax=Carboxydothermus hydrogenoformans (strain ATCC BAA-161 / DSM 6008 / Z-2901) TaxID=246194 RepID=Q3ACN8_CARHZ|nr:thiamine biosynthesis protein ThiG [Carboxydothermus hydrogenoformans Z-2901]
MFTIGGKTLKSRLFVGTGKLPDYALISRMYYEAKVEVFTVAVRRIGLNTKHEKSVLEFIPKEAVIMVNTSGATNYKEAIKIAQIGRELTSSDWVKVEIEKDTKYLFPDNYETLKACEILVKEGFKVFPYIYPDLNIAKELEQIGVTAVMPLAAPIGTNKGIGCEVLLKPIIAEVEIPVIIDAGIGRPSHAAQAMELGADAVLINTAIATAKDPLVMTLAFSKAVEAGRLAYEIGLLKEYEYAQASSPLEDFIKG